MRLCLEVFGSIKIVRKSGKESAVVRGSAVSPDGFVYKVIRKTRWRNVPTSMEAKFFKNPLVWKG